MPSIRFVTKILPIAVVLAGLAPLPAQKPFPGAIEIEQSLHRLNELGTVLMIAAHPDDERTGVLAYFARGRYMRTAYLSLTRGEGGQNLIGPEQGAQLGVIRTQELLAARQIDGAEQFFTRAIDFGFSRTAEETMEKWGHDRTLGDVVWVIRRYRPDVIILVFTGTPLDGHGQHQVSAILGKEAFEAAGDPSRFPEQLQYVQPWRATRIVHAGFPPGFGIPPAERGQLPPLPKAGETETGDFNPVLGYSYEELAVLSRSMHHSQGTGAMRRPGPTRTDFELVGGAPAAKDLFDGVDTTWNRLAGGVAVGSLVAEAIHDFDPAHPEKSIGPLVKARPLVAAMSDPLAKVKLAELDETIAQCAGIWAEAQAQQPEVTPASPLKIATTVLNRSTAEVTLEAAAVEGIWNEPLRSQPKKLGYNQGETLPYEHEIPATQPYSQPYWLVKPPAGDVYTVEDQKLIGLPDTPPVVQMRLRLTVDGAPIELVRPVHYRYADRAEGERVRPLAVVPAVGVSFPDPVTLFPASAARTVHVSVMANVAKAAGEVRLSLPAGWKAEPQSQAFQVAIAGEQREVTFQVTPPSGESTAVLRAVAIVAGREISSGVQVISYPHFPAQTLFPAAENKLVRANVSVTAHKIGYIAGAGDDMPNSLRQLGVDVTLLDPADLEHGDLSRFDAIVAGVRAYNVRADVRANHPRLMQYVSNGGTYVVQYQVGDSPDPALRNQQTLRNVNDMIARMQQAAPGSAITENLGPYLFEVPGGSRYRVTVEEAPVAFPHPDSLLLQAPNHITPKDFEGWVQERGLYFAAEWDKKYETVLSSHDPGEPPLEGGELWTRYGKGVYIFTAYSWFRQLPAGVPGAYRLFANLLSAK